MSEQQSFSVFINKRLTTAAVDIFGAVEKSVLEYQEENNRLRRKLGIAPEIKLCGNDSLNELDKQVPGTFNSADHPGIPGSDQEDPVDEAILANYPTLSRQRVSKLQSFCVFLNKCLTVAAAVEILRVIEKTVLEYQEENDQLQSLLQITPEIKLSRIDCEQFSFTVFEEEVPTEEQEWSPSLVEEDRGTKKIKQEQEEEQLQEIVHTKDSILTSPYVKSECNSRTVDLQPFHTVTHLKGLDIPCDPPDNQYNVSGTYPVGLGRSPSFDPRYRTTHRCPDRGESTAQNAELNNNLTLTKIGSNECIFCQKRYNSLGQLNDHVRKCHRVESCTCPLCGKVLKRKTYLSEHLKTHTGEKPFSCGKGCGKRFFRKNHLKRHEIICTGNEPLSCGECGKRFGLMSNLNRHKQMHTRLKTCSGGGSGGSSGGGGGGGGGFGKGFNDVKPLSGHERSRRPGKTFSCGDCGKGFTLRSSLFRHRRIHTARNTLCSVKCNNAVSVKREPLPTEEKPFSCGNCGKRFGRRKTLTTHIRIHTGEKPFSCGDCGKCFGRKDHLTKHERIHKRHKPF
ncbi:hypothetical protein DPEC_G00312150 [Dallia pectoralis]|uniref:Uncharacterized protein n=1 Tax=Dallia pectoralis TaxID=75939 RepID=A0ACC2FBH5_DALPE|nr:hypothetical protein DPEC_G00312150 [Dallia pectoralis]